MSSIGVVIATRNRRDSLARTLSELRALPERPEIVVVDNCSTDGTAVMARRSGARVIELERDVGPAARSVGVKALDAETVAFADDDSWWAPGALAQAAALMRRYPRLAVVAARILVGGEGRLDPTCAEMARSPLPARPGSLPGPPVLGFLACGAILRRSAYLAVGGFEPRFDFGGEEHLLALDLAAAGWQLAYVPEVVAHHHPERRAVGRERRGAAEVRNRLWAAWLRRSARSALATTVVVGAQSVRDGQAAALLGALGGLPWALRRRQPVPAEVEEALRRLG